MIIKGIASITFIYLLFYMAGLLFSQITKQELYKSKIVYGSVLIISTFEIISFPFLIIKSYFNVLYYAFLVLIILLIGVSLFSLVKRREWKRISVYHVIKSNSSVLSITFFATVVLQIVVVSYMHFDCYDDGYYIAASNMALEQNVIELNDKIVYAGNYILEDFNSRPGINCWELLIAFFAKLFAVHPAVLAHTFLPVLLIPLCYMAVDQVMRKMTDNTYDRFLCLYLYSLLVMFYGQGSLVPSFLVVGTWIGKALLFHLIIPLLLSECLDIVEEKQTYITWIKIGVIAVAGVGATATGIYTVPVYLLSIAVPYIVYLFYEHRTKTIIPLLKSAISSLSVFILIGVYAVASMIRIGRSESIAEQGFNIERVYRKVFIQDKTFVILFIISLVLLFWREKSVRKKILFIGQTIVLFLLILNPINAEFVAQNITGISVYWRMFLLLPVSFLVPLSGKYILDFIELRKKHIIAGIISAFFLISLITSGKGMFSVFSAHQNMYMIPNEILDICESFDISSKEMITILAESPVNRFFRQYSSYFDVIIGRSTQVSRCEKEEIYNAIYQDIYEEGKIDELTNKYLKELGVEYIVSNKIVENQKWVLYKKVDDYYIYEEKGED